MNILKLFDLWNEIKKETEFSSKELFFKERDVFFIKMGKNIGYEQNGKGNNFLRPVLILKKFNQSIFLSIPLTSNIKKKNKYYFEIKNINNRRNFVILSQIKLFDKKRLGRKIGVISKTEFIEIKKIISSYFR